MSSAGRQVLRLILLVVSITLRAIASEMRKRR